MRERPSGSAHDNLEHLISQCDPSVKYNNNSAPHILIIFYYSVVAALAPNSGLLGASQEDAALVDQWIHLAESEVDTYVDYVRALCKGAFAYNKLVSRSCSVLMS